MKKAELMLHIGSHKTGTTALQNSMFENRDILKSKGVYYDNVYTPWKMHHNLAFGLFRDALEKYFISYPCDSFYFSKVAQDPFNVIEQIKNGVSTSKEYEKVVISSEGLFGPGNFFSFHAGITMTEAQQDAINEEVIRNLHSLLNDFDVKIICYLRRQDLVLESFYNQYCKDPNPDDKSPLPTFAEYCNKRPVVMDYFREISHWARYFGKDNIILVPYEKERLPYGVVFDFYTRMLGFSNEEYNELRATDGAQANERIGRDVLEFKRLINIKGLEREYHQLSDVLGNRNEYQFYLSQNERERILQECLVTNRNLAEQFMPDEGIPLFHYEYLPGDDYSGLSLAKSIEISNKFINMLIYERNRGQIQLNNLTAQLTDLSNSNAQLLQDMELMQEQRDIAISQRDRALAERESMKEQRDSAVAEKHAMQEQRDTALIERDLLATLKDKAEYDKDIVIQEVHDVRQELHNLESRIENLRAHTKVLTEERDSLKQEISSLYNSLSWRLTRPLRVVRVVLSRII